MTNFVELWVYLSSAPLFGLTATLVVYVLAQAFYARVNHAAWANPVLWSVVTLAAGLVVGRTHGWSGVAGHVRKAYGPGWALVGDAGYFKDPATAHGMTDALRDAELLARAVVGAADSGAARAAGLHAYQATRDRLSARLFGATEQVASFRWDLEEIRRVLRLVNAAMSDEVDHLAALPSPWPDRAPGVIRPAGPGLAVNIPADTGAGASVA